MKKWKSRLIGFLIAICALCITAGAINTQNVQAATITKAQEKKALNLIKGTWYTNGGMPYHHKVVFSGKRVRMYEPGSSKACTTYKIDKITKTNYGYYFRIPLGYGYYSGYRLYTKDKRTLQSMGNGKPYSSSGYSGTSSLVRHKKLY